jgi:hypothetical protein
MKPGGDRACGTSLQRSKIRIMLRHLVSMPPNFAGNAAIATNP